MEGMKVVRSFYLQLIIRPASTEQKRVKAEKEKAGHGSKYIRETKYREFENTKEDTLLFNDQSRNTKKIIYDLYRKIHV